MKHHRLLGILTLLLFSCHSGKRIYQSTSNPYGIGFRLEAESHAFYTNRPQTENTFRLYLVNRSGNEYTIPANLGEKLQFNGYRRFYQRPYYSATDPFMLPGTAGTKVADGDSVLVLSGDLHALLSRQDAWYRDPVHSRNSLSPVYINRKKTDDYARIRVAWTAEEDLTILSNTLRIQAGPFTENIRTTSTAALIFTLIDQPPVFYTDSINPGILDCTVENKSKDDIQLFMDAGAVRFAIYAYSGNRTSVMKLAFKISGQHIVMNKVVIHPGERKSIFQAQLRDILYTDGSGYPWYWTWNKKKQPTSPLKFDNGLWVNDVELWFGIVAEGREILSDPIRLEVKHPMRKIKRRQKIK